MPNQHKHKLVRPLSYLADKLPCGSDSVNPAIARYLHLVSSPPDFTDEEWNLLRDACNGWATELEPPETLQSGLALQVFEAIEFSNLDKKWGVDGEALVQRLKELSNLEAIATVYSIEIWWSNT